MSTVFLTLVKSLLKSLLAPLLLGLLVASLGRSRGDAATGRIGLRADVYFEVVTTVALLVGWAAMEIFQPGAALPVTGGVGAARVGPNLAETLVQTVPSSGVDAMAENVDALAKNSVLPMMIFFGLIG